MYHNGLTGIWSHWAVCSPLWLPWLCLLLFLSVLCWHPTAGPHRQCRKKSKIIIRNLLVSHGSEEICWCSLDQFRLSVKYILILPWINSHSNEAAPIHFLHCHLLADLSAHSFIFQQFPVRFSSWIVKHFHVGTGTGTVGKYCSSTAARTHKFPLQTTDKQQSRNALRSSHLLIFQDHSVNRRNLTGDEMCRRENIVEHYLCSTRQSIKGLTRLGKDWTLMLQSYLNLQFKLLHKG